ncbi:hypothetical protein GCM10023257_73830 [Streptomyces hyderabadensis]|uniref:Uncharacterized protein n=1 Tax=Streptomyces hyderabadensis TaxID=598549 RepID=A0ABP9IYI8_9ACTN
MGNCSERPIFCNPWNAVFQRARAGLTVLSALIRSPSGRRYTGVDQLTDGTAVVTPSFGTHRMTAREDGPTVGYCDKAVRIREKEHGQQG